MEISQIVSAIRAEINAFKNSQDNATGAVGDERNQNGFSLNVYQDKETKEFTADVAFCEDTTKAVMISEDVYDEGVAALWVNDKSSEKLLNEMAVFLVEEDLITII